MNKKISCILFLFFLIIFSPVFGHAATLYWVGDDGANMNVASNWKISNPSSCGGGDSGSAPTNADTIIFDADCDNGATFNANITASTGSMIISSGYTGTITGNNSITYANPITLEDNMLINVVSSNTFILSGIINDNASSYSISKIGIGNLRLAGNNTFDGGVNIKAGSMAIYTSANAAGTGSITIGDTSGSESATLIGGVGVSIANNIIVPSGSSGTLTLGNGQTNQTPTFSGTINLSNNLVISTGSTTTGAKTVTVGSSIIGTGNLIINNDGAGALLISKNTGDGINMVGSITNSGAGIGSVNISGIVGSNITSIV